MKNYFPKIISFLLFASIFLTQAQENKDFDAEHTSHLMELINNKSGDIIITSEHVSSTSGVRHIYLRQAINGLEVQGTESSLHIDKQGNPVTFSYNLIKDVQSTVKTSSPAITSAQAIVSVASQMNYNVKQLQLLNEENSLNKKALYNKAGISSENISVKLIYYYVEGIGTKLVWELSVQELHTSDWWNFRVDAITGKIIDKDNLTVYCDVMGDHSTHNHNDPVNNTNIESSTSHPGELSEEYQMSLMLGSYRVFAMPVESPIHGPRTLAVNPENSTASPFGWHDTNGVAGAEFTYTRGNNVYASEDRNGNNIPGFSPDGGASLIFDFSLDLTQNPIVNESAAITNLFYWNNIIHDVMYFYGFDEASGNFQENNYGNGGLGLDSVNADAQNPGDCNANFGTPVDGSRPRMQMFLCNNTSPAADGDYDNLVIVHEYGHGISIRLTGGAGVNCLSGAEQMGEGWSDYYGYMFTMTSSHTATTSRPVGNYLFGQETTGPGIRPFPYNTDMAVNPQTYDHIKTALVPHGVGSVWATMLFDMTWDLIAVYGFDADLYSGTGGNNISLALVTEGLKLQPCSPGFVDGRDAILAADVALYGGANQCIIWDAFAKRGLGVYADQGLSSSRSDGTEDFTSPSDLAALDLIAEVCESVGILPNLVGGTPFGGVYSGPGVTDNGDGSTFTFDPAVAGPGIHTITYAVPATDCSNASSADTTIEVLESIIVTCPSNITATIDLGTCGAVVNYALPYGVSGCGSGFLENFDSVSRPLLPTDWTFTQDSGTGITWATTNTSSSSSPNAVFANNPNTVNLSSLVSPEIEIASTAAQLIFNNSYLTEAGYDGMVLEYTINGGSTWQDILNGGGSFASGGYNRTLSIGSSNPLPGRQAWSGNSGGFIETIVNLDASFDGQTVQFRWRMGSDSSVAATGVWLDDIQVVGVLSPEPVTTQTAGLASGSEFPVGTTTNTFEIEDYLGNIEYCSFDVTVNDIEYPVIECPLDQIVDISDENYSLPDYVALGMVIASDNCTDPLTIVQSPVPGTVVGAGDHTISFFTEDSSGNDAECSFTLTVNVLSNLNEGCGQGYWRSGNNWCATYAYDDNFYTAFGITNTRGVTNNNNLTLMGSLNVNGGGYKNLARQATAALLNACNPDVNYYYTVQQVIELVSEVFNNTANNASNANSLANELKTNNEINCPLNNAPKQFISNEMKVKVYPNPVSKTGIWLNLTLENDDNTFEASFYDVTGKLLATKQFTYDNLNQNYYWDINFESWSNGIYFLHIHSASISERINILKE